MSSEKNERYVRWQDNRITQMSFAINLFLGFTVASLAYAINLKIKGDAPSNIPIEATIIWWTISAFCGSIATISKLLDYRYTAKKIKDRGAFNSFMAKGCGHVTWCSFWVEIASYAFGALLFIKGVFNIPVT